MRLYNLFAEKGYHTSIATTFGLDFDTYESIVLSRLRGAGCRNNLVVADGRMLTHALSGTFDLPKYAGTHYTISPSVASGIFHPKLFLQLGQSCGRLIVGSANLTPSGIAGNLEIISTISFQHDDSAERQLIAQAWEYVSKFFSDNRIATSAQRDWMLDRTSWLHSTAPSNGPVTLEDGTTAALVTTGSHKGIGERFADMIDQPVSRLIVISPYWDRHLSALSYLASLLEPKEISVLVDPGTREFPGDAAIHIQGLKTYGRGKFREGRFIHAKLIVAITDVADHVLLGSANCTSAALGRAGFSGTNEEVCLYRCLPPKSVCSALGLMEVLSESRLVDPASLEPPESTDDLPLYELSRMNPGQFECQGDSLFWYAPAGVDATSCSVTLLDQHARPMDCVLEPFDSRGASTNRYRIGSCDCQPSFALVSFPDGRRSSLAAITSLEQLRTKIREPYPTRVQHRLAEFADDTDATIDLLDLLTELERLEGHRETLKEPVSIPRTKNDDEPDPDSIVRYRKLSYAEFVAGRRPRTSSGGIAYNSLAGSSVAIVREILNRILGPTDKSPLDVLDDTLDTHTDAFRLADETDDAEKALEEGFEFADSNISNQNDHSDDLNVRPVLKRRATHDEFVRAAGRFHERIRQRTGPGLSNFDLLRLRALLMALCAAASPDSLSTLVATGGVSRIRVLPVEGDENSWPRLIGRLLFLFFNVTSPAIRHLHLTDELDQVPGDFNECWATCYWCIQACLNAPCSEAERLWIATHLNPTAQNCLRLTLPSRDEPLLDEILRVMQCMTDRYADALRIDKFRILEGHNTLVARLYGPQGSH